MLKDTLKTWKWSPTPERYMFLRAPEGPGSGHPPDLFLPISTNIDKC